MAAWGPYIWEWGSILLRWLHVTAAIAWIGGSFFFMHLDASLRKMQDMKPGVSGVSWQVHGGGFYEMSKYTLAPAVLPEHLIWHKWQSYWTWISGFSLLCWVYYGQSSFFLIDPAVMALAPWQAALIGVVALALGWLVYDLLCKSPLAKNDALLALVGFGYVVLTSYAFTLVFSGRGALIHTGALMATMMTANVFFVIMPNQRKSVAALLAGRDARSQMGQGIQAALDAQQLHHAARAVHDAVEPLSRDLRQPRVIPALVICVIVAGALVRYFYNRLARRARQGAVVGVVRRRAGDLAPRSGSPPPPRRACGRRSASVRCRRSRRRRSTRRGRRLTSSTSWSRAARCAMRPSRCGKASARRPRACCSIRPSISPPSRRRSACRRC